MRAVIVESLSHTFTLEISRGVAAYAQEQGGWELLLVRNDELRGEMIERFRPEGIIGRFARDGVAGFDSPGIAAVNLSAECDPDEVPSVISDNEAIGRLAAEHLLGRGYGRLMYLCFGGKFAGVRARGFRERAKESGIDVATMTLWSEGGMRGMEVVSIEQFVERVRASDEPVGVMLASDHIARQAVSALMAGGVAIPERAAVLGVDNTALICEFLHPTLSSIDTALETHGYEAARLLAELVDGAPPPTEAHRIQPEGVVTRQSTDGFAMKDPHLQRALRLIHDRACDGIRVEDVLSAVHVSRSTLERRFADYVACSPHEMIMRVRLGRAKQLLEQTELPVADVAARSGFEYLSDFSRVFKKRLGLPPATWRREQRRT